MCADLLNLGAELKLLEKAGIEYLHIDIMDGVYVPNYTLGTDFVKRVKAATSIPLDIHMMVQNPTP
jgi:ribulose-phosphate 3-epimerase